METINIGLLGIDHTSENLGCQALTYSIIKIISDVSAGKKTKVTLYIQSSGEKSNLNVEEYPGIYALEIFCFRFKKPKELFSLIKKIHQEDLIIDITGGDSFSDIYGLKRFYTWSILKWWINCSRVRLILAPQTYGPYQNFFARRLANYIIKKADVVIARDSLSYEYAYTSNSDTILATDVAFTLPYEEHLYTMDTDKVNIGINISGLLYNGGYNGKNQFNLSLDYSSFTDDLILYLNRNESFHIHLIPHVICNDYNFVENDLKICHRIKEKFPKCEISPSFQTPMEAKSYISQMDIFIGARMHATIAAISCGVPTIPIAYSLKFNGLFNELNYNYFIDARNLSNDAALEYIKIYLQEVNNLKKAIKETETILQVKTDLIYKTFFNILKEI